MSPRAGLTLGSGLIVAGLTLIDFYVRRLRGAHGV